MRSSRKRQDDRGRAYAGSQLHVQTYTHCFPDVLAGAIRATLLGGETWKKIDWRAPLADRGFDEPLDRAFLEALDLEQEWPRLKLFWPRSGPRWDALAVMESDDGRPGYLLIEAKSYPDEMLGPGCSAKAPASLAMIEKALRDTKDWLGVSPDADWMGCWYQYANRLAHLYFLRERLGLSAWFVNLCFTGDMRRPTTSDGWRSALRNAKAELGLNSHDLDYAVDVLLPAKDREILVSATGD